MSGTALARRLEGLGADRRPRACGHRRVRLPHQGQQHRPAVRRGQFRVLVPSAEAAEDHGDRMQPSAAAAYGARQVRNDATQSIRLTPMQITSGGNRKPA